MTRREEKGILIKELGQQIQKVDARTYRVKSQTRKHFYTVDMTREGIVCDCPDFARGVQRCKHILAVGFYCQDRKNSPTEIIPEPEPIYTQDWSAYNAAQTEEIFFFDVLLKSLVDLIPEPGQTKGRPRLPIRETLFCAVEKVYSQLSSRRAHGLYKNAVSRKQISHAPHFNAPSKLFNDPAITPLLYELVSFSALPLAGLEECFAVDSTGFRTTTFNAYCSKKHGDRREHRFMKAHLMVGVRTNIITDVVITNENCNDITQLKKLVKKTHRGFNIKEISADKAYSSREILEFINSIGAIPYIPFKKNITGKAKGSGTWQKMFHYFQMYNDEFMKHYHKRSNIESVNAAIKRKFGETIRSKNPVAQKNELLAKVIAYNLTVIIHEMYENQIPPIFMPQPILHLKSAACT